MKNSILVIGLIVLIIGGALFLRMRKKIARQNPPGGNFFNDRQVTEPVEADEESPSDSSTDDQSADTIVSQAQELPLEVYEPANGSIAASAVVSVRGKTGSKANLYINEQELQADSQGMFATTVALEEGENFIFIIAYDEQGNISEKEVMVNFGI